MSYKIVSKIKKCLPVLINLANQTLSFIEEEVLNVPKGLNVVSKQSGDKIIINITLPGVNKDDIDFNCTKDGFVIEIKNRKDITN